ncbi:glycosyltransferase family 2 protein [Photobacterium sp. NCIMB 13483]|uniref:glycosyltransferase family 2 protein n=1 Tax=Photobacterium sp. NCIMB 13483 TaxID=2022103 RepID=UPI0011B1ED6D|nr:glycosyltransferase family 2 protein [Photobacterium sp. NCIMB 13483]
MKITVCMAVYNGQDFISEQLDSIVNQILAVDEVVIINDCSSDNTVNIISSYSNDLNITIINNKENVGVIQSFEKALYNATGDYIFLCDQDDVWKPNKVKLMVEKLNEKKGLCISDYELIDKNTKSLNNAIKIDGKNLSIIKTIIKNHYIGCSIAFNRELLDYALPFPNNIPMHDSWLGIIASYYFNVSVLNESTLFYRRHDNNVTGTRNNFIRIIKDRLGLISSFLLRISKKKLLTS